MSSAKASNRPAIAASLCVTALVLVIALLGGMNWAEGWLLSFRFAWARSTPHPLDPRIALVAIDDSSMEALGQWPFSRATQAAAVLEIARAGAKAVVFDTMFDQPSQEAGQDEAFAEAIASCSGVVGAKVDPKLVIDKLWYSADGQPVLDRLLDVLGGSIALPDDEVVEQAGLTPSWQRLFLDQRLAIRRLAAWTRLQALRRAGNRPNDLDAFESAVGMKLQLMEGKSSIRRMLAQVWDRDQSWRALARFMPPLTGTPYPDEAPPIPLIARAAGGVGMVYAAPTIGGQIRRLDPVMPTPAGDCLQLGLAGVAKLLDLDPASARLSDDALTLGSVRVPLEEGQIVVDWPTSSFEGWPILMGGGAPRSAVPFGTLASLHEQHERQARNEALYLEVADLVAAKVSRPPETLRTLPLDPVSRAAVIEMAEFMYPGAFEKGLEALPEDATMEEIDDVKLFVGWKTLAEEVVAGRAVLAREDQAMREALGGKLVFVGFVAAGVVDIVNTPYATRTPGVFVHAVVASMALTGGGLRFAPLWVDPVMILVLGVLCAFISARLGAGRGSMLALLTLTVYLAAGWLAFNSASIVVPLAAPLSAGFGSWIAGVTFVAVISQRERARVVRQFRARVSPQLVERLVSEPDALSVGGLEREVTILFGDLAGFTALSERLGGAEIVSTLNQFMGALTRELTARRAYVNKFLGDGILAFWSAFGDEPDQRRLAAESAVACQEAVNALGELPQFRDRPRIRLRLGIATGRVVVGDCGAPPELNDYTVIGDAVNLAARLESANKQFGTRVLLDGRTAEGVDGTTILIPLGRVVVVGQTTPVEVFTERNPDLTSDAVSAIDGAVALFRKGERDRARAAWREIAEHHGLAALAKPYLLAIDDPEDPCDGVLRLRAK